MLELKKDDFLKSFILKVSKFMETPYFALLLCFLEVLCYYLSLDLFIIITVSFFISFGFLFKKNLNCLLVIFLFMASMISLKNSPANIDMNSNNTFFFEPSSYITCFIAVAIPVLIVLARAIQNFILGKISFGWTSFSTILLGVIFLFNGAFSNSYNNLNFLFGLFMLFFFTIFYFSVYPDVSINKESIVFISRQVGFYILVPAIEMFIYYIRYFVDGNIITSRLDIFLGWGNRNTIGLLFVICFCFLIYMARCEKNIYFKVYSYILCFLVFVGIMMSFSRQTYLFFWLLISSYFLISAIKGNKATKLRYLILLGLWILCSFGSLLALSCFGVLDMLEMKVFGVERITLLKEAFDAFVANPIFGSGFYFVGSDPVVQLDAILPYFCHNTLLEMLGACGILGLLSYGFYRFNTIKEIFKNFCIEKVPVIMALSIIILMSLFDIHIFDLMGSAIYIVLLSMAVSKKENAVIVEENY